MKISIPSLLPWPLKMWKATEKCQQTANAKYHFSCDKTSGRQKLGWSHCASKKIFNRHYEREEKEK
jgi:hypothetical protein